ncbi:MULTISPECIES: ABC transporter ATP-binding protein [unclassified Rhodococcus (in: high G+C Gram-positive bacteria)]|uniref:ABC transporter ATP-binding protein n=1 Tax=unclassified Rhodococcus (in: high G+C Gram-positive bacteria) TaxID=192944 RepID=UPI0011ED9D37|nr:MULTISPECIES: ABC transporter ATP-binding protein [unclassified Rhodococcus (in: high G+C Gram-positive bacteria)]KAA0926296.1 ABC transporter ATP-binding protein [Rhodococcus sp. ANT_H53B]MDI9924433.1 ABC transporter ATP-binding protein [Rhodococcus sp. IEGM 1341]MDV8077608.1 ABC transporter ATP-binding protein [Rhodococcus sp. IEGM 1370]
MTDDTRLPIATAGRSWSWLRGQLAARPGLVAVTPFVGIVSAVSALAPILILGRLVDEVVAGAPPGRIVMVVVLVMIAAGVNGVFAGLMAYLVAKLGEGVVAQLREQVVTRVLALPTRTVERAGRGDVLSRISDDVSQVTRAVNGVLPAVVNAVLLIGVSVVTMYGIDWRLGLAGSLALPLYVTALRWYLPRSGPLYAAERAAMGDRSQALISNIQGARTVRAYRREDTAVASVETESERARDFSIATFTLLTRFVGKENRAELVGLTIILSTGFFLVRGDLVTLGAVTAATLMFHRLFNPLGTVLFLFDDIQSAGASLDRLVGVVDMASTRTTGIDAEPVDATLELSDVTYAYATGGDVLHGISLSVPAGSTVAVVGSTGAGKTTAALLAAGSLEPDRGSVTLGGIPLRDLGTDRLRRHIAILSQDVHVSAGPLADDLRLADPDADDTALWDALDRVRAADWVRALPEGLDTRIGENGHPLSASQGQQLALARLILSDPPVAILDEATAEAGSSGARLLEDAASAATEGRTTMIVAHRLTQAVAADTVVVLEHGRVVESGTHADLVTADGRYARLWSAWSGRTDVE